ncbi:MAG: electron transport complex subunit RsxC, partial [Oceanococcaceae bacterium]
GQHVQRGDVLAEADGLLSAPLHASTSGTIRAIEPRPLPHASLLPGPCIVLTPDGADTSRAEPLWPVPSDPDALAIEELTAIVRAAGIVGLGGAAFPSAVKLHPRDTARVDTLILNGAECEPYISCDGAAMVEDADAIVRGARLVMRASRARQVLIGIEDKNTFALQAMRGAVKAAGARHIHVHEVATRYPQGGEKQLIQTLTGQEVPSAGLPLDIGMVVLNVATAGAIWRAVTTGMPLTERIVTVTGSGIAQRRNLRVRLGTPIHALIAACGGYAGPETERRLLMGGPMMGVDLADDQRPVVKGTNCILVGTRADLAPPADPLPCIRCGDCVEVCPAGLLPQQLYWHARAHEFDKTQALNLSDCIECGCCAEVCPSALPLVHYYRFAKTEIRIAEEERRKADLARQRHEFRQERLERDKREKEEARRRKREELAQRQAAQKAAAADADAPAAAATTLPPAVLRAQERARKRQVANAAVSEATPGATPADAPKADS